ncbi:NADPH:quinone oxidoreductase family protein [Phenylobacterium sp.]|uniref:NADPH:quinone oxidoreductase family protein n=1 Tax=Phenylobacterium sp. TaxID=1871053 RepID=UPI002E2F4A4C|nr:NADPH:quinone oxidoreductase family protein [Phenylobacterium sp.]HEX3364629.1 NADPH:quinone oxidoreductase family protein [Phenylobacterium sp.]
MHAMLIEAFGPPESLAWREVPDLAPGPNEVLLEVHAIGVNFPDLLVVAGTYQDLYPLPFTPGKEAAGVVRAVGAGVVGLKPGDRVSAVMEKGAYAEQLVVAAANCYPVPDSLTLIEAAALGVAYQTAYFALHQRGRLRAGERVLVTGASGGVGMAAVQLAKAAGAFVIAAVGSPEKAELVRGLGADAVLDVSKTRDTLRQDLLSITEGAGVDLVMDQVGGAVFDESLRLLRKGGRMLVVGFASGTIPTVRANYLLLKQISVVGVHWGYFRDEDSEEAAVVQAEIFRLAVSGGGRPIIAAVVPIQEVSTGLQLIGARGVTGKIVATTRHHVEFGATAVR